MLLLVAVVLFCDMLWLILYFAVVGVSLVLHGISVVDLIGVAVVLCYVLGFFCDSLLLISAFVLSCWLLYGNFLYSFVLVCLFVDGGCIGFSAACCCSFVVVSLFWVEAGTI